jgi:MarR family transcriptional regulator, organic hydroperoxide resistance regulator
MSVNRNRGPLQAEIFDQMRHFAAGAVLFNQRVSERVGVHPTDLQCVNLLSVLGACTPGKLAEFTGLTTGGVTVMLDRLEQAGYIKREPNPCDRRSLLVRASAKKSEKIDAEYAGVAKQLDEYIEHVPDAELEVVVRFLKQVNAIRMNSSLRPEP